MAEIGNGDFGEALDPGIHHWYGLTYNQHKKQYPEIFEVMKSGKNKEITLSVSGFGLVPQKVSGASVSYETTSENWVHTLVHVTFGLGFSVARELVEDDLYGIINKLPKALARSVNQTVEITSANVLNRGHNSSYKGADGLELFSEVHLLGGGGTFQNEPSVAADLDSTSFEQAELDINDMPDDKGLRNAFKGKKLIVAAENRWQAAKLLGSDKVPEDANNAISPAKGYMPYSVNSYLTDPDAWFIKTDVPDGLVFYWRRMPEFTRDNDFDSENAKWKTTMRFIVGWDDPRGMYGSPGQ